MLNKKQWARLIKGPRPKNPAPLVCSNTPCAEAPDIARCILERAIGEYGLTPAQREVAAWMVLGDSSDVIAEERGTTRGTATNQASAVFNSADVCSRYEFQGDVLRKVLRLCARELATSPRQRRARGEP